jgi:indole-3-glycerol phosphate synthase/phosphoribosylanthranilate isomerase
LFDSGGGGTGRSFDWALLSDREDLPKAFLAGGINPANAAPAARVGAYGLDLSSGVESAPGVKDPCRIDALFSALRPLSRKDRPCA